MKKPLLSLYIMAFLFSFPSIVLSCSRFTYTGSNNIVMVGRSMDWYEDIKTDLWAFPAGIQRTGSHEKNSTKWTSRYGSVIASGYNIGTTDGINTEGLAANLLYLSTADYGKPKSDRKSISILMWAQYFLDNYATVDEAVKDFGQDKFNMIGSALPGGTNPTVHLSISDKTGDNAIFEYVNGVLVVHHNKKYNVMTNEPVYDKQLALNDYWQNLKGIFLPGTGEPEDRFVRASYYVNTAPQTSDPNQAAAIAFSIIRNVSVPLSATTPEKPNVSSTIWRSVADLKNLYYYFDSVEKPNVFWVDLHQCDLKKGASIKKLPLQNGETYAGEVSHKMISATPF